MSHPHSLPRTTRRMHLRDPLDAVEDRRTAGRERRLSASVTARSIGSVRQRAATMLIRLGEHLEGRQRLGEAVPRQ